MSGYCIDHDKHFLDTCPSCQEKKECREYECEMSGHHIHTKTGHELGRFCSSPECPTGLHHKNLCGTFTPSRAEGCGYGVAEARIDRNLNSFRALPLTPEIRDEDILELRRWMLADVIELLLSSRQSAIEECVKAVETASKVSCRDCSHLTCISRRIILNALIPLLREESEDKKGV